jgi:pimeloyl-ACP methyl ester carboxylesterase
MARKILGLYMVIVLVLLTAFPAVYFLQSSYQVEIKTKPRSYHGDLYFVASHDGYELAYRSINNLSDTTIVYYLDTPGKNSYPVEKAIVGDLKKYNHIFIDHRGTGKSERIKSLSAYSVSNMSRDIHTIISELKLKNYILVSHGVSTIIAQEFIKNTDLKPLKTIFISPVIDFDRSAKTAARNLSMDYYINDKDSVQTMEYFELYGYSIDDEVGFFGTSKIIAMLENSKKWLLDTNKYDLLDPTIAIKEKLYTYEEIYDINHPSLTIGLFYSLFKTDYTESYNLLKDTSILIFGLNDHFSKTAFDSIKHKIKFPFKDYYYSSSSYYPHIEESLLFTSFLRELL